MCWHASNASHTLCDAKILVFIITFSYVLTYATRSTYIMWYHDTRVHNEVSTFIETYVTCIKSMPRYSFSYLGFHVGFYTCHTSHTLCDAKIPVFIFTFSYVLTSVTCITSMKWCHDTRFHIAVFTLVSICVDVRHLQHIHHVMPRYLFSYSRFHMCWRTSRASHTLCDAKIVNAYVDYVGLHHSRRRSDSKYSDLKIGRFSRRSFEVTGTPFTHVKTCLKIWGLPRKRVWYVRGLQWRLVDKLAVVIIGWFSHKEPRGRGTPIRGVLWKVIARSWMSHVTHMDESCHMYEWNMNMSASCHTHEWKMSHTCTKHATYMNDQCHMYDWVMSPSYKT